MRNAILAGLMLLTVGCGAYAFPGGSAGGAGTVSGNVISVPCAPVESSSNPCAGRPAAGVELVFRSGDTTANTVTDARGNYSINLGTGTWQVTLKSYMRIISGPSSVTVTAGSQVVANYVVDDGIRVVKARG